MWNLKLDPDGLSETETELGHREQTGGCQGGRVGGEDWTGSLGLADGSCDM